MWVERRVQVACIYESVGIVDCRFGIDYYMKRRFDGAVLPTISGPYLIAKSV